MTMCNFECDDDHMAMIMTPILSAFIGFIIYYLMMIANHCIKEDHIFYCSLLIFILIFLIVFEICLIFISIGHCMRLCYCIVMNCYNKNNNDEILLLQTHNYPNINEKNDRYNTF